MIEVEMNQLFENKKRYFRKHCRLQSFTLYSSKVHSIAWNNNGRYIASSSHDGTVCVSSVDQETIKKKNVYKEHSGRVDQVCWNPQNSNVFTSVSDDKTVRIWDIRTDSAVQVIETSGENINVCWSPNGKTIAVGNKSDLVSLIDTDTFTIFKEEQFKFEVNQIKWDSENEYFYVTCGNGCVLIYDNQLKCLQTLKAHTANCICLDYDPNKKCLAVGGADALVSLWDTTENICINTISRLDYPVCSVSFSHDGDLIASTSEESCIDIAMVSSTEQVCEIPCGGPVFSIAWHPSSYLLAYAFEERDKKENEIGNIHLFGFPGSTEGILI